MTITKSPITFSPVAYEAKVDSNIYIHKTR